MILERVLVPVAILSRINISWNILFNYDYKIKMYTEFS